MFFADLLNLFVYPFPLLVLLLAVAWYNVFKPPQGERFTRLRRRAIRRREVYRAFFLLLALSCTLVLAAFVYALVSGAWAATK